MYFIQYIQYHDQGTYAEVYYPPFQPPQVTELQLNEWHKTVVADGKQTLLFIFGTLTLIPRI
jgi:hypothetical protein